LDFVNLALCHLLFGRFTDRQYWSQKRLGRLWIFANFNQVVIQNNWFLLLGVQGARMDFDVFAAFALANYILIIFHYQI
jgi:hypothetical protein